MIKSIVLKRPHRKIVKRLAMTKVIPIEPHEMTSHALISLIEVEAFRAAHTNRLYFIQPNLKVKTLDVLISLKEKKQN